MRIQYDLGWKAFVDFYVTSTSVLFFQKLFCKVSVAILRLILGSTASICFPAKVGHFAESRCTLRHIVRGTVTSGNLRWHEDQLSLAIRQDYRFLSGDKYFCTARQKP